MIISIDTETERFGPGNMAPPIACLSFSDGNGEGLIHWTETAEWCRDFLESGEEAVFHGGAYDWCVIGNQSPDLWPLIFQAHLDDRIHDTEVDQKLIDIEDGIYRTYTPEDDEEDEAEEDEEPKKQRFTRVTYDLAALTKRHLGRTLDKKDTWRLRYGELMQTPLIWWPKEAQDYAKEDARATLEVWAHQYPRKSVDSFRQVRSALWLKLMANKGLITDPVGIDKFERSTKAERNGVAANLIGCGLLRPDTRKRDGSIKQGAKDTKAARMMMIEAYQGRELPLTPKGQKIAKVGGHIDPLKHCSTARKPCQKSGDPVLKLYARYGTLARVLSSDIPMLRIGLIHSHFEVLKESGRTGSSAPNVQNVRTRDKDEYDPFRVDFMNILGLEADHESGVRECFVPRPGYVFVNADYSGAELATMAEVWTSLFGWSKLADAINAGRDAHLDVASDILGVPYEELLILNDAKDRTVYEARQTGKIVDFGCPGGLGPKGLVGYASQNYNVELTEAKATYLKRIWSNKWPETKLYFKYIADLVETGRPIVQLYSGRLRGKMGFCDACNTLFQGLAADMAKDAGFEIVKATMTVGSPLYGCFVVNFIHDEFMLEVPEGREHEASEELSQLMLDASKRWLKHVSVKVEATASLRWSKKTERVIKEGRLVAV